MTPNSLPSERAGLVGVIKPDATTAGTVTTAWVPAKNFHSFLAVVMAGDLGTGATVNAKLQQATDISGTGAKDITGKAITALTEAGTDSNKQALINLRAEQLDVDGGFAFVRLSLTVATATSDVAALLFGFDARFGPATDFDATTVDEVVN